MAEKACTKCSQVKPVIEFRQNKRVKSGLHSQCRECDRKDAARWRLNNPEKEKAQNKRLYDRRKASGEHDRRITEWREKNRAKYLASMIANTKKWAAANPEKVKQHQRVWREKHIESIRAKNRRNSLAFYHRVKALDPELFREKQRAYYLRNPEKGRQYANYRRVKLLAITVGVVDYSAILKRDGMFCYLCRNPITEGKIHFDHVIPISRGGSHSLENVKVTHAFCNLSKHDKSVEEWRAINGIL